MSETESMSAELRRAEQERDEAIRRLARFEQIEDDTAAWRDAAKFQHALDEAVTIATGELRAELASARQELDAVRTARDNLDRELARWRATARDVIAKHGWIVARDNGWGCVRCDRQIRRGEAYEYLPGADEPQHIHCPDREGDARA